MTPLAQNPLYALSQECYDYCLRKCHPKLAIDIGANDGGYTAIMLQHGYNVVAFEPVPDVFEKLRQRYHDNPHVRCLQRGVSDAPGKLEKVTVLSCWTLGTPDKIKLSVCPDYVGRPSFDVELVALDGMTWPDGVGIIKLDVDGYELKVLRGAATLLGVWQPPILCEFSRYIQFCGDSFEEFVNTIFRLGYHVFSMDGKRRFLDWPSIQPHYPDDTSFDVMLIPRHMSDQVLAHFQ